MLPAWQTIDAGVTLPDVVLDLEQLVADKVADEFAAMNGRLEALIKDAVDKELGRLVRQLVEANIEGRATGVEAAETPDGVRTETGGLRRSGAAVVGK
jgi:hypothetical protein